jgi:ABC-type multidrug transport system fused ATPase/permease subunit
MLKTLKKFYTFLLHQRKAAFIATLFFVFTSSATAAFLPYFYKLFINALTTGAIDSLFNLVLMYFGISMLSLILSMFSYYLGDIVVFNAAVFSRSTIFKHVMDLDFTFHSNKSTGSLISAFKRGDGAFFDMFHIIHHRLADVLVGFAVMIFFFSQLNFLIALTSLLSMVLAIIISRVLIGVNVKRRKIFNKEEDKISGIVADNMINYETVKLFAKESYERGRLAEAFKPWLTALWGFGNSFRYIDISIGTLINLSMLTILTVSVNSTGAGVMNIGDFVLVAGFTSSFFPRLWDLVWSSRDMARAYSDIQTYFNLLDNEEDVKDPTKPVAVDHVYGEINLNKVYFTYGGRSKNAINGISLKIEQGQSVALVGRSGSGKTTIAKLLMRFYDIESGDITIDGINIRDFAKSNLRGFVGVVPQEPILFNNTIAYNIGYGKVNAKLSEVKKAAKLANIHDFIESLKDKYETEVGERGVKLSGGQKQRLAIARMILSNPDIIIFDEATSHLDSESEKLIQDAFWKARAGKTTIIIAHRLSTIMKADKIVVMDKGKIAETGSHVDLLNNKSGIYRHLWDLQVDSH